MYLTFDATGTDSVTEFDNKLDLSDLIENGENVTDEDSLFTLLVAKVAQWCVGKGVSFMDTFPLHIIDDMTWNESADKLDAGPDTEPQVWLKEIAQFAWFVEKGNQYLDRDQVFAYVNNVGWKWVDFDSLEEEVGERFFKELTSDRWGSIDYHEFAKEYMSDFEVESVPEHLEKYFDYDAFGRDTVDEFESHEWNNKTFLYHQ